MTAKLIILTFPQNLTQVFVQGYEVHFVSCGSYFQGIIGLFLFDFFLLPLDVDAFPSIAHHLSYVALGSKLLCSVPTFCPFLASQPVKHLVPMPFLNLPALLPAPTSV